MNLPEIGGKLWCVKKLEMKCSKLAEYLNNYIC